MSKTEKIGIVISNKTLEAGTLEYKARTDEKARFINENELKKLLKLT